MTTTTHTAPTAASAKTTTIPELVEWLDQVYAHAVITQEEYNVLLRHVASTCASGPAALVGWLDQAYADGVIPQAVYDVLLRHAATTEQTAAQAENAYLEYEADRYEARTTDYPAAPSKQYLAALGA